MTHSKLPIGSWLRDAPWIILGILALFVAIIKVKEG